jgi:hypothetical protein
MVLHEKVWPRSPRITALQREILGKDGTVGEIKAKVAQSRGRITETELRIRQLDRELARWRRRSATLETRIAELGALEGGGGGPADARLHDQRVAGGDDQLQTGQETRIRLSAFDQRATRRSWPSSRD